MSKNSSIGVALLALFVAIVSADPSLAQTWPNRPIKLIVPYTPGGSTDVTARLVSEQLRIILGQPFVIENRGGAGANIGAAAAAKAEPDGYNFMMATSTHATNVSLYRICRTILCGILPRSHRRRSYRTCSW